ncbi:telomere-associated protein Tap [Streptomyces purpurogeneiscleroticus]|uniref:telomere-associated protein Tap n=1 Tax=Streptomyces purpurogeneiscleroticus TaxID=68259 RepID=UPI001CBE2EFB|nr:helix-turn-helix domain-containing protein [Streptomyces purpurogeneiscleroticus]MBZ4018025.1 transcriptional regulator [Streptomyces purpurogeneiscleroticus]
MPTEEELFEAVDALLAGEPQLPPPAERARLREAAGVTQARLAQVLKSTTQTVKNWEAGRSEPRPPRLQAYRRLLEGWAAQYPPEPVPETFTAAAPQEPTPPPSFAPAPAAPVPEAAPAERPKPTSTSRRPATKKATPKPTAAADPRFPHGPLAVLDGEGNAYCAGGVVLDCPAKTIPQLVDWTLTESGLGAPRLHRHGKDADPLIALTAAAAVRLGLPERLEGPEARRSLRLPEDHPVVKQIAKAKWKLTQRGFGPWPRIYRPAQAGQRRCVQLAVLPWDALDTRAWPGAADLSPADLARVLGTYAQRVLTPRGSTAVSGLELMTALRPPTRPVNDDATGAWVSGPNPGALTAPVDPAPPEATAEHPVAQGWDGGFLDEEAYQWVRDVQLLSDEECLLPHAVGLDINTAFLAAAARLSVGLGEPVHVDRPVFDKKVPGSWYVDLSHIELDPRLPSPFTPSGRRPDGPAWYATPTVAYAVELGYDVTPTEAYIRTETGPYLDPWHDRLKTAYVDTLADLGVTGNLDEHAFLTAMEHHKQTDPGLAAVLTAIKSTVKGGIGKLRERPQGRHYRDGERWPALERPTWSPDIRAAVISKARVNMHRKMRKTAEAVGLYPLAVLSDCVVYPSPGPSPLDFLPRTRDGKPVPGSFRLGPTPGLAKVEGVQTMAWAVDLMEQQYNPARHIKGDGHDAVLEGE